MTIYGILREFDPISMYPFYTAGRGIKGDQITSCVENSSN